MSKNAPLRKVIERGIRGEYKGLEFHRLVKLECGHLVPPSTDFYGETSTVRQRCKLCQEEKTNTAP